jgi:ATP adenylyltransferase
MEYVEAPTFSSEKNPFLEIPAAEDDQRTYLLHRGAHCYLLLNRYPYNAGHLLAIPYREVAGLADLTADERADLMDCLVLGQDILTRAIKPDGFNIGFNIGRAAGAGLPSHLHGHIVPRWEGDTNFMPVLGQTRVLPDSLDSMWRRLRAHCPDASMNDS